MKLAAMPKAGGSQREFPSLNQGRFPRDRPEEIRFSDVVVIQPIAALVFESIGVESPAAIGNRDADLIFFIALAVQRSKSQTLAFRQLEERAGGRHDRGGLIKLAVECAKNPVQARDFDGDAKAGVHCGFHDVGRKVRLAETGDQSQPGSDLEFVAEKYFLEPSG